MDEMKALRGARVLMTGGTGFVGHAMRDYFIEANRTLRLGAILYITTRMIPQPTYCGDDVWLLPGTASNSEMQKVTHIIHLEPTPVENMLALAKRDNAIFLFASSGAARIPNTQYAQSKAYGEILCWYAHQEIDVQAKIARLWAFVGPHLPLDGQYAIGNFIRDGLAGGPIVVNGDGKAIRSYLYTTDLAHWMWTILVSGKPATIYNVGSEDAISISDLAYKVAGLVTETPKWKVNVEIRNQPDVPSTHYVPDTSKAREQLGLSQTVGLDEAIAKTIAFYKERHG